MTSISIGSRRRFIAGLGAASAGAFAHAAAESNYIAQRHGVVVDRIAIALDEHEHASIVRRFAAAITPATRVISVSHVISSTGLRMPIAEISALARARGILCVVDGRGEKMQVTYTYKYDGRDYPMTGSASYDTLNAVRIDALTVKSEEKRNGKTVGIAVRTVSADGKVLTITDQGTNRKGQAFSQVLVFDRQ